MRLSTRTAAFGAVRLAVAAPSLAATVATGGAGTPGAGGITFLGGGATADRHGSRPGA